MRKTIVVRILAVLAVSGMLCACTKSEVRNPDMEEKSEVDTTIYDTRDNKKGVVAKGDKVDVADQDLEGLKLDLSNLPEHSGKVGDLKLSEDSEKEIDWSGGGLSVSDFENVRETVIGLYQDKLNKKERRYVVMMDDMWDGDTSNFDTPVFYYVDEYGILYIQTKVIVYDTEEGTAEPRFVALGVRYDENGKLVLMDEER